MCVSYYIPKLRSVLGEGTEFK